MPSHGVTDDSVKALREQIESAIGAAVERLRKIETTAQQELREARLEQEYLKNLINELNYRVQTIAASPTPPVTVTGPLTPDQISALQGQEENLTGRLAHLEQHQFELEQISNRLAWLVHQIEGASDWVLASGENDPDTEGEHDTQHPSNEQVMWAQIIMGQEAERARLAREIHDGPAQALSNAVMRLQFVEQLFRHKPDEVQPELGRMRSSLQASLADVRRFMFNLRPASLSDIGLLPTLRQYVRDYSKQYACPVDMTLPDALSLSPNQELVVFRVIQEALQNIHKHANASHIRIEMGHPAGTALTVTIWDDGKGFDPRAARQRTPSSSGLVSMRERAASVGGTLKIESTPNAGTTITMVLPATRGESR